MTSDLPGTVTDAARVVKVIAGFARPCASRGQPGLFPVWEG